MQRITASITARNPSSHLFPSRHFTTTSPQRMTASTHICEATMQPSKEVARAVDQVFVMFKSRDVKEQSSIIREVYSSDPPAVFVDALMKVHGTRDIALEFYSLIRTMVSLDIAIKDTTYSAAKEPGVTKAVVENAQHYVLERKSWFAKKVYPETIDLEVTTTLLVDDTGKVLSHEEHWKNKSVPVPSFAKPFIGTSTALLFRLLGWGKDIAPSATTAFTSEQ